MDSEIVVKSRMSLNMMVRSWISPPGRIYFSGSFSFYEMTAGERYCEKVLRICRFSPSSNTTLKLVAEMYEIASVVAGTTMLYQWPQCTNAKYTKATKAARTIIAVKVAVNGLHRPNQ